MISEPKNLILFTSAFPYGEGEQFIETEIKFLAEAFDTIYIYPLVRTGNKRVLPDNAIVMEHELYKPYNRLKLLRKNWFKIIYVYLSEILISKHRMLYITRFKKYFNYLLHRFSDADWFLDHVIREKNEKVLLYSYWFNLWAEVLSIAQLKSKATLPILARLHGGDYDEGRKKDGYPFRYFEMSQWRFLYPVSSYGVNYLKKQFPYYDGTLEVSRLGVLNHGDNPIVKTEEFTIVSCSFLIPLKRVHLIVEILNHLKVNVKWIHFGAGPLMESILARAKALPQNISYEFKGYVSNSEILDYYKNKPVDFFVNVSEREGIPVSIMEAISFGIPVMGCNICGVPEIVNEKTGFLLDVDFNPARAATLIQDYLMSSEEKKNEMRKRTKAFWQLEYDAEKNYNAFINDQLRKVMAIQ